MTPVIETLLLVVIAIVALFAVLMVFGEFRSSKEEIPVNPSIPGETAKPVMNNYKVYTAPDLEDTVVRGTVCRYNKTNRFLRTKEGDYYEIISSSNGAFFYMKDGKRRYINVKKEGIPTFSREELI